MIHNNWIRITPLAMLTLAACSGDRQATSTTQAQSQVGIPAANGSVVRSRASFRITTDGANNLLAISRILPDPSPLPSASPSPMPSTDPVPSPVPSTIPSPAPSPMPSTLPSPAPSPAPSSNTSAAQPISVINAPNTSMTLETKDWLVPTIQNGVVDFGFIGIASLMDNNLHVCGTMGDQVCKTASIRTYTTGVAGAGLWNVRDQYGAPLSCSLGAGTPVQAIGLDTAGAVTLQSIDIPATKHTLRLSDLTPTPRYNVKVDFTDAGAGTYTTTLVIEYVLAP